MMQLLLNLWVSRILLIQGDIDADVQLWDLFYMIKIFWRSIDIIFVLHILYFDLINVFN